MIELKDITSAQRIIAGRVHRTPLMSSISLGTTGACFDE